MAKKLFTLFMLLALFFGVGWAETVTVTKTMNEVVAENGYIVSSESEINTICAYFFLGDNVIVGTLGEPDCGTFWGTSTIEYRLYENKYGNLIIGAYNCTLQSVTITYSDASTGVLTYNGNDVPSGTPCAVSGNEVMFEIRGTTAASGQAQVGITSISVTYEKREIVKGEWHQVKSSDDLGIGRYEYIIIDSENTKVAGAYENGHFTALPCEGNVEFCDNDIWGRGTLNVTGDDVKTFTMEYRGSGGYSVYCYLKDADGNYYYPENGRISISSYKKELECKCNNGQVSMTYNRYTIGYNTDESYFGSYTGNVANYNGIRIYFRPKPMTLKEMREDKQTSGNFKISNELQIVKSIIRFESGVVALICKDDGPAFDATDTSIISDNCEDYMTAHVGFSGDWDQSNWALLQIQPHSLQDLEKIKACEGMRLAANTLTLQRTYTDKDNIRSSVDMNDLVIVEGSQPTTYTPNLYCPANFLSGNHNGNATGHDAEGNPTENHYFFMNPKLQELCEITYAMWVPGGTYNNGGFLLPPSDGTNNPANIYGYVNANWSLNNDPIIDPETGDKQNRPEGLEEGGVYRFKAVVFGPWNYYVKDGSPSLKKDEEHVIPGNYRDDIYNDNYYTIYPIDFDPKEHIITRIQDVVDVTDKTVAGVKYYNLAGIESDRPFEGVNIIVTTYTDGSRSSSKVLK